MAIRGTEVGDAYITIHTDMRRAREEIRRDLRRAAQQAGDEAGDEFSVRFRRSLSPLGQRMARDLGDMGSLSGRSFGDLFADEVKGKIDALERDLVRGFVNNDWSAFARNFDDLDEAFIQGRIALEQMNREGRVSESVFRDANAALEEWHVEEIAEKNRLALEKMAEDRRIAMEKEAEDWDNLGRLQERALREMEVHFERRNLRLRRDAERSARALDRMSYGFVVMGNRLRAMGRSPLTAAITTFFSWPFRIAAGGIQAVNRALVGLPEMVDKMVDGFSAMLNFLPNLADRLTETANGLSQMGTLGAKAATGLLGMARGLGGLGSAAGPLSAALAILAVEMTAFLTLIGAAGIGALFSSFVGGISAAVASLTALAAGLWSAAGAAAFFLPMISSLVGGLLVSIPAFKGVIDALSSFGEALNETDPEKKAEAMAEYREQLEKMGPATRGVVEALEPMIEGFDKFQEYSSERIFAGLGEQIKRMDFSVLQPGLDAVLDGVNQFITQLLSLGENDQYLRSLNESLQGSETILGNLGRTVSGWTQGLQGIIEAATPFAERLSEVLADAAQTWGEWATSVEGQDALTKTFETAWEAGKSLWNIITDLIGAFGDLFTNSSEEGQTFLDKIEELAETFRDWINEVAEDGRLEDWLTAGKEFASQLADTIGDIWQKWQEIDTPENRKAFNTVMNFLGAIIVVAGDIIDFLDDMWDRITNVDYALGLFFTTLRSMSIPGPMRLLVQLAERATAALRHVEDFRLPSINIPYWLTRLQALAASIATSLNSVRNFKMPRISVPNINLPWNASGAIYSGPSVVGVGEAGPEAIVPLNRPLSQVDPSVRALSAIAQGKAVGGQGVTIQVVTPNADPRMVAVAALDEIAARGYA